MSIRPSSSTEIRTLLTALASDDEIKREAAIARLAIMGARAVDRMLAAYPAADRETRIALLRAFEAIADPRALRIARQALADGGDVGIAAAGTLHALLDSPVDSAATEALDALVAAALSGTLERRVRLAAFDALREMPADIRGRVEAALQEDPDQSMRPAVTADASGGRSADLAWQDAVEGRLPDDPEALRDGVGTRAAAAPLGVLQHLIDAVRSRERDTSVETRRHAWRALRGSLHQALALRGSTIALYDLRETIEGAREPLPPSFIAALHVVGDASLLEAIAAAYAAAADAGDATARWRGQLEGAFKAIVAREKVSRRSAVIKRVEKKWPAAAPALIPAPGRKSAR
jgi:hypothetical protein